jgi:mRNA interferase MazF
MNRGDIYWVNLDPTQGSEINKLRPCVLVGATPINKARHTVVVVPLSTSAQARPPITIAVSCLGKQVTAICDQIRTVDKSRLTKQAGKLSIKDLTALDDGLRQILTL